MNNQLTTIQSEGLELTVVETAKGKYIPFLQHIAEIAEQSKSINWDAPTTGDEQLARELRLKLVPNRTSADRFKKEQKDQYVLVAKLHDACYNIINAESKILENQLEAVENFTERQEQARLDALKISRAAELKPYTDFDMPNLELMSEEQFKTLLDGQILSYQKKLDDQKAAQELARKTEQFNRRKQELSKFEVFGYIINITIDSNQDEFLKECESASNFKREFEAKQLALETENAKLKESDNRRAKLESIGMIFAAEKFSYQKAVGHLVEFEYGIIKEMAPNEFDLTVQFCQQEIKQSQEDRLEIYTKLLLDNGFVRHNIDAFKKGHHLLPVAIIVESTQQEIHDSITRINGLVDADKEIEVSKSSDKTKMIHALSGIKLIAPDLKSDESKATWNVIQQKFDGFIKWANTQLRREKVD